MIAGFKVGIVHLNVPLTHTHEITSLNPHLVQLLILSFIGAFSLSSATQLAQLRKHGLVWGVVVTEPLAGGGLVCLQRRRSFLCQGMTG